MARAPDTPREPETARSRARLTACGRWLLAGGLAGAGVAVAIDERDLLALALVIALLPAIAALFVVPIRPQAHARYHVTPARLVVGAPGVVSLHLTGVTARGPVMTLEQPVVPGLLRAAPRLIAPLGAGQERSIGYAVQPRRRGRYRVGPPTLSVRDPLGLWERSQVLVGVGSEVVVVPTVVELVDLPRTGTGRASSRSGATSAVAGGDPDVGVRPYLVGDDPRTIHWRASARLEDDLMVRITREAGLGTAAMLLDTRGNGYVTNPAARDVAASLAASIGLHLLNADVATAFHDHTGADLASGQDVADDLLVALAGLPDDAASPAFRPAFPGRPDLVVAITGVLTPAELGALARARPKGVTGIALVVGGRGFGKQEHDGAASLVSRLTASGWRAALADPLVLAPRSGPVDAASVDALWRQVCVVR